MKTFIQLIFCALLLNASKSVQAATIDCPDSTSTKAVSLNNHGWVVGICTFGYATQSFYRTPDGVVHILKVQNSQTFIVDINDSNVIVGQYQEKDLTLHAFLWAAGRVTLIDPPGARNTYPSGINAAGAVTGSYWSSGFAGSQGFVRDASGDFTTFTVPSSSGPTPASINSNGDVAGSFYNPSSGTVQAFVRDAAGNITEFSVPGATGTNAVAINDAGFIAGTWSAGNPGYAQGFTRDPLGNITTFEAAHTGPLGTTAVMSINASGIVAGTGFPGTAPFWDFGFTQSGSLNPHNFRHPDATSDTYVDKINDLGVVAGWYSDGHTIHGFFGKP